MFIVSLEQPPVVSSHPMANCFHRRASSSVVVSGRGATSGVYISPPARKTQKSDSDIDLLKLNLASATKTTKTREDSSSSSGPESASDTATGTEGTTTAAAAENESSGSMATPNKTSVSGDNSSSEGSISSFFIGLSFQIGATQADITPAVSVSPSFHSLILFAKHFYRSSCLVSISGP